MLSLREGAKQRRALDRVREDTYRDGQKQVVRELREQLTVERAKRDASLKQTSEQCRADRLAVREKARARRERALAELREAFAQERLLAREACACRKAEVHKTAKDPIERTKGKWEAERKYQADLRRIEQGNRKQHHAVKRAHASERRSESDDEVRSNLQPEYLALFERVKRGIKGSSRESRTEAFLRYAEQNAKELVAALDDDSERVIRELEEQRTKAERALRAHPPPRKASRYTPEELAAVPF